MLGFAHFQAGCYMEIAGFRDIQYEMPDPA